MSLATRITLLVAALLAACGVLAGAAFHRAARRSLEAELQGGLDARLAWLAAALDVELGDGQLQLDAPDEPAGAAATTRWQVATTDGRVLWASAGPAPAEPVNRTRTVTFGKPDAPPVAPAGVVADDDASAGTARSGWAALPLADVPAAAAEAARRAVPGLEPRLAFRKTRVKKRSTGGEPTLELHGTAGGREHAVRLNAAGNVLRVRDRPADPFAEYQLPPGAARVDLVLTAQASAAEARAELSRLTRTLWTVGPLALALTAAVLALLIRWQLRPLARMAEQAASIGPATASPGVSPAGGSAELVRLRGAINSMLARLAEGLERERRFSATAAHELRTPLAQMRTTVEVALRRPREAPAYRAALEEVSEDIQRLQKLVVGLLHLTRGSEANRAQGSPVPLAPLIRRAAKQCGPLRVADGAADGTADGAGGDGRWVYGDADLLHAALCNVLENAARYAPAEPPALRVESDAQGATVLVIISDRGPGIPEPDRERVFQPLTRLDDGRTAAAGAEGFGLGLAVARATARAFGGDLVCRGRADEAAGAEFAFTLRRAAPPEADSSPDVSPLTAAAKPS
jgi:signal transduction histidine kinase